MSETIRPSYYAVIPANVRYSKDVCDGAKLLYAEITCLCNERGYCWATNGYFAELYNVKADTISRWISSLAKAGFILTIVDSSEGNSRKIWLTDSQKNADPYRQKSRYPIGKKADTLSAKKPIPIGKKADSNNKENNKENNESENARAGGGDFFDAREGYVVETIAFGEEKEREGCLPPAPAPPPAPCQAEASAKTVEEAEARIAAWAKGEGFETVKQRHELARRHYSPADAQRIAAHFCSIYGEPGQPKRGALLSDPVEFFRVKLSSYLANQNGFERAQAQKQAGTSARPAQTQSVLPKALRK